MKNILLILSTIILFGLSAFFRKMTVDRIHPYQLQVIASIIYIAELPLWLWLLSKSSNVTSYNFSGIIFGTCCIATYIVAAVLFGMLMKSSDSIGTLSTIISMNPIITSIFSYLILNEQFTIKKIIAMIVTLVGISLFSL